jgi:outer membrane protein TolC
VVAGVLAIGVVVPGRVVGQEAWTLARALEVADRGAYVVRVAGAEVRERSAGRLEVLRGIVPTVRIESGLVRTTDPVSAFGLGLLQRRITQADFDPARLNRPGVVEDRVGGVVVEVPLVNVDAWWGLGAGGRATAAAGAAMRWQVLSTRAGVVRAYYGAVLAAERVGTLEAAVAAARAHVRQAEAMVAQGVATRSDALLAAVKAGEVEAELVSARGEARSAVRGLATLLGRPEELPVLPATLPSADAVRRVVGAEVGSGSGAGRRGGAVGGGLLMERGVGAVVEERLDVRAARFGVEAAGRDAWRVRSAWLPRVNAFGRYDWHSVAGPFRGEESWTAGVMAQWTPIAGGAQWAAVRAAGARRDAAEARAEAAVANARLEVETTAERLAAAVERLAIAERAVEQAAEAHRIVARKYDGGLATVVELLDASAVDTRTRLALSGAVHAVIEAGAARALALGADPAVFTALDDAAAATAAGAGAGARVRGGGVGARDELTGDVHGDRGE